ncbi:hypothetical protein RBA69_13350 [Brenneria goodwinii]|uniref:hypothetical protein n=1 Tax=Brenneria goodwinii TaxID=1109412 RepID=UPI0036E88152
MDRTIINSLSSEINSHSRYHFKLENTTVPLSLLHFTAQKKLSKIYRITFTSEADDLNPARILNRTATLAFNPPKINTFGLPDLCVKFMASSGYFPAYRTRQQRRVATLAGQSLTLTTGGQLNINMQAQGGNIST